MKKKELSKLTDVYTCTNPTVELDSIHTLSLVPFFDGLFVYSPDDMFDYTISDLIKEFNMSHEDKHIIVFVKKTMTQNEDYITNIKEYVQMKIILSWLSTQQSVHSFTSFFHMFKRNHEELFEVSTKLPEHINLKYNFN